MGPGENERAEARPIAGPFRTGDWLRIEKRQPNFRVRLF